MNRFLQGRLARLATLAVVCLAALGAGSVLALAANGMPGGGAGGGRPYLPRLHAGPTDMATVYALIAFVVVCIVGLVLWGIFSARRERHTAASPSAEGGVSQLPTSGAKRRRAA